MGRRGAARRVVLLPLTALLLRGKGSSATFAIEFHARQRRRSRRPDAASRYRFGVAGERLGDHPRDACCGRDAVVRTPAEFAPALRGQASVHDRLAPASRRTWFSAIRSRHERLRTPRCKGPFGNQLSGREPFGDPDPVAPTKRRRRGRTALISSRSRSLRPHAIATWPSSPDISSSPPPRRVLDYRSTTARARPPRRSSSMYAPRSNEPSRTPALGFRRR